MSDQILDNPQFEGGKAYDFDSRYEQILQEGFEMNVEGWFRKAWEVFKKEPGYFIALLVITWVANAVVGLIAQAFGDFMGSIVNIAGSILLIPMTMGFAIVARKILNNEPYEFSNLFGGYKKATDLIVVSILYGILVVIGLVLLVIPGIYLMFGYIWATYIVFFHDKGAWEALECSRKMITKNWGWMALFVFLGGLAAFLLGTIACLIGLFATLPVFYVAIYISFHDTMNEEAFEGELETGPIEPAM